MLQQFLFWALAGPKYVRRFVLLWLVLIGLVFYAFVNEAFDGSSAAMPSSRQPAPSSPINR
jgi:hypothetical protein